MIVLICSCTSCLGRMSEAELFKPDSLIFSMARRAERVPCDVPPPDLATAWPRAGAAAVGRVLEEEVRNALEFEGAIRVVGPAQAALGRRHVKDRGVDVVGGRSHHHVRGGLVARAGSSSAGRQQLANALMEARAPLKPQRSRVLSPMAALWSRCH